MANNISLPPTLEDEREFMEMMEQRMKERINTINSACNSKRKEICKIPQTTFPGSLYNKNFKVSFHFFKILKTGINSCVFVVIYILSTLL